MKYTIRLNQNRCVCCYACVIACLDGHYGIDENGPVLRTAIREENADGKIRCYTRACQHCRNAKCIAACPSGAIFRDESTGLVLVDTARCIGCRKCAQVCPFGAPKFRSDGRMVKCDGCIDRIRRGEEPLCVKTCPSSALTLVKQESK